MQAIAALLVWLSPDADVNQDLCAMLGDAFFKAIEDNVTQEESCILLDTLHRIDTAFTIRASTAPVFVRLYSTLARAMKYPIQDDPKQVEHLLPLRAPHHTPALDCLLSTNSRLWTWALE